tara:strand:+ start:537 stop:638 length:102 start_codon:yes stop_codon:yes gene_type:complete
MVNERKGPASFFSMSSLCECRNEEEEEEEEERK